MVSEQTCLPGSSGAGVKIQPVQQEGMDALFTPQMRKDFFFSVLGDSVELELFN